VKKGDGDWEHVSPTVQSEDNGAPAAQPGEGAFNPETGEINWDCPCLGGMAQGPW